jgi:NitT/TauT family transport system substrate-binding protein
MLLVSSCMREPETTLRIGTNVWVGNEPRYLARDLGYLNPSTVQLVEYPSASEVMRAFRNQAIDGMVLTLDELFVLAVDELQPRIILVVDVSNGADAIVGRRGMRSMRDLKGKSVAVESGALGAFVLSRALALNGMQVSDVNVVHLEPSDHSRGFEKGQVDGAVTFDPYRIELLQLGATTLFDSTQIPGEIVDLLAVRATIVEKKPNAIQALLTAWFSALDYITREPRTRRDAWGYASKRRESNFSRRRRASMFHPAMPISGCSAGRHRSWRLPDANSSP